jgi:4-amino-4-deoxy-L-arabinose transferase-like glycosyltransferase
MFFNGNLIPEGEFGPEYSYYYPLSFLWRTTPIVLLGLFLGVCSIFLKSARQNFWKEKGFSALAFLCAALLIVFFFTLSAKKADRYILPAMVYLDVVAALGYFAFISYFPWKIKSPKKIGVILIMLVVVILQIGMVVQAYPYFHSYYNPMLGGLEKAQQVMQVGWGEGLNEAAEYLNQVPMKTRYLRVITWYSAAFDYHFVAVSDEIPISGPVDDALMGDFFEADYLVIYLSQRQRNSAHRLLDFLEDKTPEHIVKIRGVEYVWVYNMGEIIEQMDRENE